MAVKKKPSKRVTMRKPRQNKLAQVAAELARTKIEIAKKSVAGTAWKAPAINVRPIAEPQAFWVRARMIETPEIGYGPKTFLARIPVTLTTIPELPEVVRIANQFFVLTTTLPVTYSQKQYAEATRL
jgi:hypothetical protein